MMGTIFWSPSAKARHMKLLADFIVDSDLCLPEGTPPVEIHSGAEKWDLSLSNIKPGADAVTAQLAARLTFEHADGLIGARDAAREKLASAMNALAYATNRKFAAATLIKIVDWTPGKVERQALIFVEAPLDDRAEPGLTADFAGSANRFLAMQSSHAQASAMRWYRVAIGEGIQEAQFTYFWFALEIAAQALKATEKRYSKCPRCHSKLYCETCQVHPMHRPYPGEAIRQLVERVHPKNTEEVFETLQKIRHTLLHGERIESIAAELPCTSEQAVNRLAVVTWHAIRLMFDKKMDPEPDKTWVLGNPATVVRMTVVATANVLTGMKGGDPANPRIEDFPNIEASVQFAPRQPPTAARPEDGEAK
jgi:hypothetical protein